MDLGTGVFCMVDCWAYETLRIPCRPALYACSSLFYCMQMADTLAAVPRMRPEAFNRLFDDNLQDLLMVSYLSSLTRTQLAIAEKLAT